MSVSQSAGRYIPLGWLAGGPQASHCHGPLLLHPSVCTWQQLQPGEDLHLLFYHEENSWGGHWWVYDTVLTLTSVFMTDCVDNSNNNNNNRIERRNSRCFTISSPHCKPCQIYTLKWPRRNCVQIICNTSSVHHVQRFTCHIVRRDSSAIKFDRV